ncbi:MAG: hypothetical protein ABL933_05040 [Methyloglobulus sp.]
MGNFITIWQAIADSILTGSSLKGFPFYLVFRVGVQRPCPWRTKTVTTVLSGN